MKYSIKVNEVRAKEGRNIKGFATVVFGDSFKITMRLRKHFARYKYLKAALRCDNPCEHGFA